MKHPFIKALAAEAYIVCLALCVVYAPQWYPAYLGAPGPALSIGLFLSTFVFSAAVMGYFFLSEPLLLAIGGKIREAIKYFIFTLCYFAAVAAASLLILLYLGL